MEQLTGRSTPVQFNNYAAGSLWRDPAPAIVDTLHQDQHIWTPAIP